MDFSFLYFYLSFLSVGTFSMLWTNRQQNTESSDESLEEEDEFSPFTDISSHDSHDSLETLFSIINQSKTNDCSKRVKTPIAYKSTWEKEEEEEKWREKQKEEKQNQRKELQKIWNKSYS